MGVPFRVTHLVYILLPAAHPTHATLLLTIIFFTNFLHLFVPTIFLHRYQEFWKGGGSLKKIKSQQFFKASFSDHGLIDDSMTYIVAEMDGIILLFSSLDPRPHLSLHLGNEGRWRRLALQLQKSTTRDRRVCMRYTAFCSKPHPLWELVLFELVRKGGHVPLVPCSGSATGFNIISLMNQPPFFWNHRLSTLVIILCAKTEFRLDQSNCRSPVRWWTWRQQRTALCSTHLDNHYTHALRMVNTSYIEAATKHKQGKQGSLGTDLAPQQNTSRERCLRLAICITIRKYVWA